MGSSEEWTRMEHGKFVCPEVFFFQNDSGDWPVYQTHSVIQAYSSSYLFHYHSVIQHYNTTRDTNRGEAVILLSVDASARHSWTLGGEQKITIPLYDTTRVNPIVSRVRLTTADR